MIFHFVTAFFCRCVICEIGSFSLDQFKITLLSVCPLLLSSFVYLFMILLIFNSLSSISIRFEVYLKSRYPVSFLP